MSIPQQRQPEEPARRADRPSTLRWWVYALPIALFLLGLVLGALIW